MLMAILLVFFGIVLSAFFSGSETGFYRVTRVRLVMDAKSGTWISRTLLWLVNHPSVVVATVLIGNNIANYLVSFGLLLASQRLLAGWDERFQTALPILMTPMLFVYGELLPKYLFYHVPYQLLRSTAPLMVLCTGLFLPVSCLVIALEAIWQRFSGNSVSRLGVRLERQDLQRALLEGQEAGVVRPIQREIAQNLFTYGARPVRQFAVPLRAIACVGINADRHEILRIAQSMNQQLVGILDGSRLVGCYQVSDILIAAESATLTVTPVCSVLPSDSNIQVLTRLQSLQCPLAVVVDAQNKQLGVVPRKRLSALLLSEQ